MNRHLLNLLLVIFSIFACSLFKRCSVEKIIFERNQTKLTSGKMSKSEIHDEIDFFLEQVEAISPDPYLFAKKTKIDSLIKIVKSKDELMVIDFFEKMLTLTGMFNIAHLYLSFPNNSYNNDVKEKGGRFPYRCTILNDTLTVMEKYDVDSNIQVGDKIISINNKNADSLFMDFYKYTGGINAWKKLKTINNFHRYLWLNNIFGPFELDTYNKEEGIKRQVVLGVKKKTKTRNDSKNIESFQNQYKYAFKNRIFYNKIYDSIAYIDFNQMDIYENIEDYDIFLNHVFEDIKNTDTNFLIIDVRGNSGGNSLIGKKMIDYINYKPFRMSGGKKWKVTREYKDNFKKMFPIYLRPFLKTDSTIKRYFNSPNNTFIDSQEEKLITAPLKNNLSFTQDVYLIIDNGTFSSANIFANAIEDFGMATLIGDRSGEIVNDYGEIVSVKLKKSGIYSWIPSAVFNRANGDTDDINPVIPDIYIRQDELTNMSSSDLVDFVISLRLN